MNAREGMRRVGIVVGVIGCLTGGLIGYSDLQNVWSSHTKFDRLQALPVMHNVATAIKVYQDAQRVRRPIYLDEQGNPKPTPQPAAQAKPHQGQYSIDDIQPGSQPAADSQQTLSQQDVHDLIQVRDTLRRAGDPRAQKVDVLIQSQKKVLTFRAEDIDVEMPDGTVITGVPPGITQSELMRRYAAQFGTETVASLAARIKAKYPEYAAIDDRELVRRLISKYPVYQNRLSSQALQELSSPMRSMTIRPEDIDSSAPNSFIPDVLPARKADASDKIADPTAEITVDVNNLEDIKTVNADKTGAISSIELTTGERICREPRTFKARLAFIARLLLPFCYPVIGFLIPWGTIRVLIWVGSGFLAPPS